ncbi:MAG TPA: alcohol dehydrogenase catalytic domain-containing protein [Burkholderiales bacterium]|nr:alcohol dehydrogenase catalytic domain-containing protein [Burkholderiales bacterium]
MKFRAAVLRQAGATGPYSTSRPLAIETVELPPPAAGEVLVEIKAASICHSDLSVVNGDRRWPLPIVPGHEAAGVVAQTGAGVESVAAGDHVALIFLTQCGSCERCVEGKAYLCARGTQANREGRLISGGPRLALDGAPLHHHMGLAAFAEYALVSEKSLVKIPRELGFVEASLFGCAVMCGAGSALYSAKIAPGERVAVVGLGGVGLAAIMGARLAGATRIAAIDRNAAKAELALAVGATAFFTTEEMTEKDFDAALDATGTVEGFELSLELTRRGGRTVTVSLPDAQRKFSFPLARLVAEARTVAGSYIGSCLPSRDIPAFVSLYRQGRLPVDRLVTRTLALEDINEAMDELAEARALRQVVTF